MYFKLYFEFPFFPADHAVGLSTFTIMAGLGGSMGYVMGAVDWGWLGKLASEYLIRRSII